MDIPLSTTLPAACAICGHEEGISPVTITRTYTPQWVWFFLPLGALPAILLGALMQVKHRFAVNLCSQCKKRRTLAAPVSLLSTIVCTTLFFVAVIAGMATKSWIVFGLGIGVTATIAYLSGRFDERAMPSFPIYTRDVVEMDIPGKGRFTLFDNRGK